jgi:hypothetical protein
MRNKQPRVFTYGIEDETTIGVQLYLPFISVDRIHKGIVGSRTRIILQLEGLCAEVTVCVPIPAQLRVAGRHTQELRPAEMSRMSAHLATRQSRLAKDESELNRTLQASDSIFSIPPNPAVLAHCSPVGPCYKVVKLFGLAKHTIFGRHWSQQLPENHHFARSQRKLRFRTLQPW